MYSGHDNWDEDNRQTLLEGKRILERTGESLARSNQIAIETETIGTEVVTELGSQRETLLRAKDRLTNADDQLDNTRRILKKMGRNVIYNKLVLVMIILLELGILIAVSYMKFIKK
ncbi:PREDICTED: vesicle transport through interaction with t-SNAREs homolog 1B [Nicrophorus vespilloides]|uniref:Vesicle transport through interaction with t-SNAREs homolog 1B n=1 Tax=Nicrophorus vespilloides TaxID=110193 RepID=A0ABM1MQE9_NICVS|nr:PREDICTED: vesicle transport through interaction with t-SNAREs homolog 1B [Nicrophorus vespilloides]